MKVKTGAEKLFDALLYGDFNSIIRRKRRRHRAGGSAGSELELSNNTTKDNALVGDLVGVFSVVGGTGTYTYSLLLNPSGFFSISGSDLLVAAALTAGTDMIIVEADNGAGDVIVQLFSIKISHVVVGYVPTYELLGF